jgi:hypothetical protein
MFLVTARGLDVFSSRYSIKGFSIMIQITYKYLVPTS